MVAVENIFTAQCMINNELPKLIAFPGGVAPGSVEGAPIRKIRFNVFVAKRRIKEAVEGLDGIAMADFGTPESVFLSLNLVAPNRC